MDTMTKQDDYLDQIRTLIQKAKDLAREYYRLTGKPLGITGEVAEIEAAEKLGLQLSKARTPGYDATAVRNGCEVKYQIKGRCVFDHAKPGQRLGSIKLEHAWDAVLLVLLDQNLDVIEIIEAQREQVEIALKVPGSRARNERGALSISKFQSLGKRVWPCP